MNKNKIILSISLSIVLVLCLVIGATYAYWNKTIVSENNLVLSGCFNITFSNESNDISLNRAYPITDEEANNLTPYSFRVTNSCNVKAKYNINLETLTGSTLDTNLLNVSLSSDMPKRLGSLDAASTELDNGLSSNTLVEGILKPGKSIDYNLRVWLPYDITNEQGQNKSWNGKVVLNAVGTDEVILADLMNKIDFGNTISNAGFNGTSYTSFEYTNEIPTGWTYIADVSASYSEYPIYLYVNGNDIKLYTEAEKIAFNENSSYFFSSNQSLKELDLTNFDFSKVVNASSMFSGSHITSFDFSNKKMSSITDMGFMFNKAYAETIDFTNADMTNVTNMTYMFNESSFENIIGLETVKVDKIENVSSIFENMKNLNIDIDLSNWNTSNLKHAGNMFRDSYVTSINLDNWDFSGLEDNVSDIQIFYNLKNLESASLRNVKFSNLSKLDFNTTITSIDITGADFSHVTDMSWFFNGLPNLNELIGIKDIDVSNVTNMSNLFVNVGLTEIDLSGWDISNVTSYGMFYGCEKLERLTIDNMVFNNNTNMLSALGAPIKVKYLSAKNIKEGSKTYDTPPICQSLETIDITGMDISKRTSINSMFYGFRVLKNIIGIKSLDVSRFTDFGSMFSSCYALETIDLSNWNTSNATDFNCLFASDNNLKNIVGLDNLNASNVRNFTAMFAGCSSLELPNLSSWNVSNATNMSSMFASTNLNNNISSMQNWDVSNVTSFNQMFASAKNLSDATPLNNWNVSNTATFEKMLKDVTLDSYPTWDGTWDTSTGTFTPN